MIYSEIKVGSVEEIQRRLGNFKAKTPLVLSRAINRAISNVKKNMGKETSALYFISSSDVTNTVRIVKSSKSSLKAAAISAGGGIALSKFKVKPFTYRKKLPPSENRRKWKPPRVYEAGVKKDGGMKPLDGNPKAFLVQMQSGHVGVMERKTGKSFPIKQLYGPSVPQIVKNEKIMTKINKEASETLQKRIDAEINNILRKG